MNLCCKCKLLSQILYETFTQNIHLLRFDLFRNAKCNWTSLAKNQIGFRSTKNHVIINKDKLLFSAISLNTSFYNRRFSMLHFFTFVIPICLIYLTCKRYGGDFFNISCLFPWAQKFHLFLKVYVCTSTVLSMMYKVQW